MASIAFLVHIELPTTMQITIFINCIWNTLFNHRDNLAANRALIELHNCTSHS